MTFQRRCNELVLLLSGPCDRQVLRDAVFAHGRIVDHPARGTASAVASGAVIAG